MQPEARARIIARISWLTGRAVSSQILEIRFLSDVAHEKSEGAF